MNSSSKANILVPLVLMWLAILRGLLYAAAVPPWQAPDEFRHFEYVRLIVDKGRLVDYGDLSQPLQEEIIASMVDHQYWRFGYAPRPYDQANPPHTFEEVVAPVIAHSLYQPPLYYALAALWLFPFSQVDATTQLLIVRSFSVLLGAFTVLVAFLTTREVFPDDPFMTIGVPMMVALLPMHTSINSSVNSDNLAELLVSLVILVVIRSLRRGFLLHALLLLPLLLLAWFTKRTALIGVPIALGAIPFCLWTRRVHIPLKRFLVSIGLFAALGSLALLFWSSLQGWLLGPLRKAAGYLILSENLGQLAQAFSPQTFPLYLHFLRTLFESFWGRFGWMSIPLPPFWYRIIALITLIALGGLIAFWVKVAKKPWLSSRQERSATVLLILAAVSALLLVMVGMIRVRTIVPEALPQGRYLFPVIIPLTFLFMLGLREAVPQRLRSAFLLVTMNAFFFFDLVCLFYYLVPYYYG